MHSRHKTSSSHSTRHKSHKSHQIPINSAITTSASASTPTLTTTTPSRHLSTTPTRASTPTPFQSSRRHRSGDEPINKAPAHLKSKVSIHHTSRQQATCPFSPDPNAPPVTINSLITRGPMKGNILHEAPDAFFERSRDIGDLFFYPGLQESTAALRKTPFYTSFDTDPMNCYQIDKNWAKKYDLCADPSLIPPNWGIGHNLRFGSTRHATARFNYYRGLLDKSFHVLSLVATCNNHKLLQKVFLDVSSIENFRDMGSFGVWTLARHKPFESPDENEDGTYLEYKFDQFDDEGNCIDPDLLERLGSSIHDETIAPNPDSALTSKHGAGARKYGSGARAKLKKEQLGGEKYVQNPDRWATHHGGRSGVPQLFEVTENDVNLPLRTKFGTSLGQKQDQGQAETDIDFTDPSSNSNSSSTSTKNLKAGQTAATKTPRKSKKATSKENDDADDDEDAAAIAKEEQLLNAEFIAGAEVDLGAGAEDLEAGPTSVDVPVPLADEFVAQQKDIKGKKMTKAEMAVFELDFANFVGSMADRVGEAEIGLNASSQSQAQSAGSDGNAKTVKMTVGSDTTAETAATPKPKRKRGDPPAPKPRKLTKEERIALQDTLEVDLDQSLLPPGMVDMPLFELRLAVQEQVNHTISMHALDLFHNKTMGLSDAFYGSSPSPYSLMLYQQHITRASTRSMLNPRMHSQGMLFPIIDPDATPLVKTTLNKHVRDYLEPYMEVPDSLPPNFVFLSTTQTANMESAGLNYLVGLSAIDGSANEFSANIEPQWDDKTRKELLETAGPSLLEQFAAKPAVPPAMALDAFTQWLYHPTSSRAPLHFTPNQKYHNPLASLPLWKRIRSKVSVVNATKLEMMALPPVVRKLFTQTRKGEVNNRNAMQFDFFSGVLTHNGLRIAMAEKISVPMRTRVSEVGRRQLFVNIQDNATDSEGTFRSDQTDRLPAHMTGKQGVHGSVLRDENNNIIREVELVEVGSADHPPFPDLSDARTPSPVSPIMFIGQNPSRSLHSLDANLRVMDYKLHGSNLRTGFTPAQLYAMTAEQRGQILPQAHRDTAPNSLRRSLFDAGINTFSVTDPIHTLFSVEPRSISITLAENLHAVMANHDRSVTSFHTLTKAQYFRDFFFLPGIVGAFFRAELHRAYETAVNRGTYSLHHDVNYPDHLWHDDLTLGQVGPMETNLLKFDFKSFNYVPQESSSSKDNDGYHMMGIPVNRHLLFAPKQSGGQDSYYNINTNSIDPVWFGTGQGTLYQ